VAPVNGKDYTTNDYVKLHSKLFLAEFEISTKALPILAPIRSFDGGVRPQPTQPLRWYHSYNLTKHDRQTHFSEATLVNCIAAVAPMIACLAVASVQIPLQ